MMQLRVLLPYLAAMVLVSLALGAAYSHGVNVERAEWTARTNAALADAMQQTAQAQAKAREAEQASAHAMATIDNAYQQGRADAQAEADRIITDLRAGTVRVRDRFTCPPSTGGVSQASTSPSSSDAGQAGGLQQQDAQFLVRLAAEADDVVRQLKACQSIVMQDRAQ